MENAMFWLGLLVGCPAGFMIAWWFACKGPPPESFFWHIFKLENKSVRLNSRMMLYDLQTKVDDLLTEIRNMDFNLQSLSDSSSGQAVNKNAEKIGRMDPLNPSLPASGGERGSSKVLRQDVERLYQEGLNSEEIAQKLKMGKGEVELVLALGKKPTWGIGIENGFKKG